MDIPPRLFRFVLISFGWGKSIDVSRSNTQCAICKTRYFVECVNIMDYYDDRILESRSVRVLVHSDLLAPEVESSCQVSIPVCRYAFLCSKLAVSDSTFFVFDTKLYVDQEYSKIYQLLKH